MASNPFSTGSNGRPKGSAFSPSEFTNPLNRERYEDAIREDLRRKKQEESDFYTQQDQQIRLANDVAKAQADALKKQREAQERAAKEAAENQKKFRNSAMEREAAITGRGYLTDAFGNIQWNTDDETWQKQQDDERAEFIEKRKKEMESDRQAGIRLQEAKYNNAIKQLDKQQEHMRESGYDAEGYEKDVQSLPQTRAELINNLNNAGAFDDYVDSLPEEQRDTAYQAIDAGEVEEEVLTGLKKTNPTAFVEYDKKQKRIESGKELKERYDSLTQRIQAIEKEAGMTGPVATTEESLAESASIIDQDRLSLEQLIEERNTRVSFSEQDNARRLSEIEEIQAKLTGDGATAEEIAKLRDDALNSRLSMLSRQKQEDEKINELNAQIEYKTDRLNAAIRSYNEALEDLVPTTDSLPASRETKPGAAALDPETPGEGYGHYEQILSEPETPTPSASPPMAPETPSRPLERFGMDLMDGEETVATIEEDDELDRVVIVKDYSRLDDILADPRRKKNAKPVYLPLQGTRRPSDEVKSEIEGLKAKMEKLSNRLKETGNTSEEEMTEVQNLGTQSVEKALREFGRGEISVDHLNSIARAARFPESGISLYDQYIYKPSLIEKEEAAKVRAKVESSKVSEEPFSFPKYAKMAIRQALSTDLGGTLPKGSGLLAEPLLSKVGLSRGSARDQMIQELTEFNAAAEKIYEENMEYFHESTSRMGLSDEDAAIWTMQQIYDAMPRRKQGAAETAIKVLNNLDEYSAFIGGFNKIDNFSPLLELQYKLDNGKELTEQDRKLAEWWASQDQRDKDVWAQVIDIGAIMPGFMAEILLTGGTASVVRKGGEKLAGKVVGEKIKNVFKKEFAVRARNEAKRAFTKKIIDQGANKAAIAAARKKAAISKMDLAEESLMNLPRHAVEAAIQTPLARGSHIVHDALKNANIADYSNAHPDIESWLRSPGKPVTQAILGAGFDNYAELLSEKLGVEIVKVGAFMKLPKDWQDKLAKLGLVKAFRRLNAGLSDTEVGGIMRRAEWHGWMTEVAEERVGDAIRALGYTASGGYIGEEFKWPTRDQWIAEIIAMSLPGGAAFAANETHMRMVDSSVRKEWEKAIAFGEQSLKSDPADLADKYNEQRPDQETLTPEQMAAGQEMFGTNNLAEVDALIAKAEASYEKARSEGNTKALKVIGEQIRQMKATRGVAAAGSAGRSAVLAQQYTEQLAEAEARAQEAQATGDNAAFQQAQADIEAINQAIEARRQIFSAPVQEPGPTPTVEPEGNQTTSTPGDSASTESKNSQESDATSNPAESPASEAESTAPESTSATEPGTSPDATEAAEQARQERINNLKFYAEDAGVSEQEAQRLAEDYVNRNPDAKDAGVEGANLKFEINKNAERVEALIKAAGGRPSDEIRKKAEEFVANNPESRGREEVPAFLASLQNEDGTGIPPVVPETKKRETSQSESTAVTSDKSHARAKDPEFKFRDISTVTQKGKDYIRLIQAELAKLGPSFINSIVLYEATPGDGDSGMFYSTDENGIGRLYIDPNRLAKNFTESKLLKGVSEEWIHSFVTTAVSRKDAIEFWNAMPEKLKEKTRRSYYHTRRNPPEITTDTEKYQMFNEFMRMVLQEKGIKLRDGKVLIEEGSVTEFDISPGFADRLVRMLKKLKREFEKALQKLTGDLKNQMDAYVGRVDDLINEVNKASSNQDTSRSQQTGSPSPPPSFDNLYPTISKLKENPIAAKPPGLDLRIQQARERGKQPNPRDRQLLSDYDGQPTLSEYSGPARSALQGVFVREGGMQPDQAASLLGFDSVDEMYEAIRQELNSAGASMQGLTREQRNLIEEAKAAGLTVEQAREMAGAEGVAFNQRMTDVYLSAAPTIAPDQNTLTLSAAPSFIGIPRTLTYFSGGGLVEEGLRGIINPVAAVEFDPDIAAAYKDAHGDHITIDDINNVDPASFGKVDYFHASPVCKNSSLLKSKKRGGGEKVCDITAAKSTARVIKESSPSVVTIENVPSYAKTKAAKVIRDALSDEGYIFDEGIYDASEYGAPTSRKRYLVRATRNGLLPDPVKVDGPGWYETIEDIIDELPNSSIARAKYIHRSLPEQGVDPFNVDEPILVSGTTLFKKVAFSRPNEPAFTFKATPATVDRILLPGGKVKRVTAKAKARMTGLPDSYKLPADEKTALTIIGNGVPPDLVRNVFGPLFDGYQAPTQPSTPLRAAPTVENSDEVVEPGTLGDDVELSDLEDQTDPNRPDDINWDLPPDESPALRAAPTINLESMPVIDTGMLAQISEETDKVGMIHIDRMIVGAFRGRTLHGGLHYPAQEEMLDAGAVWAFNSKSVASAVLNKGRETNGYIALALMQEGNVIGNQDFLALWIDDLNRAIDAGVISNTNALKIINETRARLVANNTEGERLRKDGRHNEDFETLDEFYDVLKTMTQTARGNTYFQKQWNKKLKTPATTYGGLLGVKMRKAGMPDPVTIVKGIEHPAFDGLANTTIIGMIRVDPDGGVHKAKDLGVTPHPSYQYIVKGTPVGVFSKVTTVEKIRPDMKGQIMSQQKEVYDPLEIQSPSGASVALRAAPTITPEQDAAYLAAVESGDVETQQRMVDEAAKAAGGIGPLLRGDGKAFEVFDTDRRGESTKTESAKKAFFFTDKESAAQTFGLMSANNEAEIAMRKEQENLAQQNQELLGVLFEGIDEPFISSALELNLIEDRQAKLLRKAFIEKNKGLLPMARGILSKGNLSDPLLLRLVQEQSGTSLDADTLVRWAEINSQLVSESSLQWLSYREKTKERLGLGEKGIVRSFYLFLGDVEEIDYQGESSREGPITYSAAIDQALSRGDNGIIFRNTKDAGEVIDIYAAFNPNEIKSADPVTRDADGNVIPLSQRFDESESSILRAAPTMPALQDDLGFYSGVESVIAEKMPRRATPQQVMGILNPAKNPVKKAELDWMGIEEWMEDKQQVEKDDVLEFVRANKVRFEEVEKAQPLTPQQRLAKEYETEFDEEEGGWVAIDKNGEYARSWGGSLIVTSNESDLADAIYDEEAGVFNDNTKYSQYTIPGGENYREILLTLPDRAREYPTFEEWQDDIDPEYESLDEEGRREVYDEEARWAKNEDRSNYRSSHWYDPNVVVHMRVDDRVDSEGNKVLFIQEIQSDWAGDINKQGVRDEAEIGRLEEKAQQIRKDLASIRVEEFWLINPRTREIVDSFDTRYEAQVAQRYFTRSKNIYVVIQPEMVIPEGKTEEYDRLDNQLQDVEQKLSASQGAAPPMPYAKTYHELALKRLLLMATEQGYDKIAFTTGKQQIDLYTDNLRQNIQEIAWNKDDRGNINVRAIKESRTGEIVFNEDFIDEKLEGRGKSLDEVLGKNIADQIRNSEEQSGNIRGDNLSIGGQFHKLMYDQMIPSFLNKFAKKWGGKVSTSELGGRKKITQEMIDAAYARGDYEEGYSLTEEMEQQEFGTEMTRDKSADGEATLTQPSLEITPAMRESIQTQGVPLFAAPTVTTNETTEPFQYTEQEYVPEPSESNDAFAAERGFNIGPVYHGTAELYDQFKNPTADLGIHFGSPNQALWRLSRAQDDGSPGFAERTYPRTGERVIGVYLKQQNPLRMRDIAMWDDPFTIIEELKTMGFDDMPNINTKDFSPGGIAKQFEAIRDYLIGKGYDGIVYQNDFEGLTDQGESTGDSYIAFAPEDTMMFSRGLDLQAARRSDSILRAAPTLSEANYARHAELEAKHDAGTVTPEETAEAERIVEEAAQGAGFSQVVYHAGEENIRVFRPYELGIHVAQNSDLAESAREKMGKSKGVTMRLRISSDKYIETKGMPNGWNFYDLVVNLKNEGSITQDQANKYGNLYFTRVEPKDKVLDEDDMKKAERRLFRRLMDELDADGIKYINEFDAGVNTLTKVAGVDTGIQPDLSYVVAYPEQIKSADPFTGVPLSERFDPSEDSILRAAPTVTTTSKTPDPGNTIFDAALRSIGRIVGNAKTVGDVKKFMAGLYAKPFAEPVRRTVDFLVKQGAPLQRLPQEVRSLMNELRAKQSLGGERAMDVIRSVKGNSKFSDLHMPPELVNNKEKQKQLFMAMDKNYADKENAPKLENFSQEIQDYAKQLREILIKTGEAAVAAGRMHPDTFLAMKEGYMPHYYYQHEKAKQKLGGIFLRMKLGIEDIMAQRQSMWRIEDQINKGADDLPLLLEWDDNGKGRPRFRSRQHRDAFYEEMILEKAANQIRLRSRVKIFNDESKRMSHNVTPEDLKQPHKLTPELRGYFAAAEQKLRQQYRKQDPLTIQQQEEAGLIMDPVYAIARHVAQMEHDNATAEFFNQINENPNWVSEEERPGFVQLPKTRRLGRLSGKFVEEKIAEEITELVNVPDTAARLYDGLLTLWKTGKTVYNPGTHVRNVMGNVLFAQMAGISPIDLRNAKYYKEAFREIRNGGPLLEEMLESGVLGADFLTAELRKEIQQVLPEDMWKSDDFMLKMSSILSRAFKRVGGQKAQQFIEGAYQMEDELFKAAAYIGAKDRGMSDQDAAFHVRKWFPYYDNIGSSFFIKSMKRGPMPFFSFYRESIRILANAAKERPFTLAASMALPAAISKLNAVAALPFFGLVYGLGLDDDEWTEIKDTSMRGKGRFLLRDEPLFSVLLPYRNSQGKAQQWDLTNVMPFASLLGRKLEIDNGVPAWQQWALEMISGSPITGIPLEMAFNKNTFTNKPIWEENMTTGEKWSKAMDHVWTKSVPPLAPGGTGFKTLARSGRRRTDKSLETRDPVQSVLRAAVGLDVRSASPNIYDLAENFRKQEGLPKPEFIQVGSTAVGRARRAVWEEVAQTDENRDNDRLVRNLAYLSSEDKPIRTKQDINRMLFFRNPLMVIDGEDNRRKFRRSLTPEARETLEKSLKDFEEISRKAGPIIMKANRDVRRLELEQKAN